MAKRKPAARRPHWKVNLDFCWKAMKKAKRRAKRTGLEVDWEEFREKQRKFTVANTERRRRLTEKTEKMLKRGHNNAVQEVINVDKKRREERNRQAAAKDEKLSPASFTHFMGEHHDQRKEETEMTHFTPPQGMREEVIKSIAKAKRNKAPGVDGVNHEMLKIEPILTEELIVEIWRIIGRFKTYLEEWKLGLLTPIYKKGNASEQGNYRPVCMLPSIRNTIEKAFVYLIARKIDIHWRQFGFQHGLSLSMTLIDVDALVKSGQKRIPTPDLTKAYDKANRKLLLDDCRKRLGKSTIGMIAACLQPLTVTTKGDILGTKAVIKLELTQGAPLSAMLFLIYIDDLPEY